MRAPRPPGTPIDAVRRAEWLGAFQGYRVAVTPDRVSNWLSQFAEAHRDAAARVLDCVSFVKGEDIEEEFRNLAANLPGWNRDQTKRSGKWRFLAFSKSAGESGDTMLHTFRTALKLSGKQFDDLFIHKSELLTEDLGPDDSVVFIDDFAGTGNQAVAAWNGFLRELLPEEPSAYLMLVAAGRRGVNRIHGETSLEVRTQRILEDEDDVFANACTHFSSADRETLLRYGRRADSRNPRGYLDCGFVLVLAHKTPNNSLPILHANHPRWRGLFPRMGS